MQHGRLLATVTFAATLILSGCNTDNSAAEVAEHLERSDTYLAQNQYRSAMLELRNALQKATDNTKPAIDLANVMLRLGSANQAAMLLEPWFEAGRTEVGLTLADAYARRGKWVSATETLALSPDSGDNPARRLRVEGNIARLSGDTTQAERLYRSALEQDSANEQAAMALASLYTVAGNTSQALTVIENFHSQNSPTANSQLALARIQYQTDNLDLAAETLIAGLEQVPTSDFFLPERRAILTLLTRIMTEQGNMTQAMIYNNILTENSNTEVSESAESAVEALRAGEIDTARGILETLIQRNPDNDLVALLLGTVAMQQGDEAQGLPLLTENIDAEISPIPFIRIATMAQVDQGDRNEALATLDRALLARPGDVDLLAMHGILALADPLRAADGVASLTKALQINENRSRLRMALAQHWLGQGQTEQALGYLRSAFERTPTDWAVTDFYLSVLLQQGLTGEVAELRDQLAAEYPDDPNAQMLTSMADFRLGNRTAAINRLQQHDQNAPSYALSQNALGGMLTAEGRNEDAIGAYLNAAIANPDNIQPLQQAGRLYAQTSSPAEVIQWLDGTAEQQATLADTAGALAAQILIQQGDIEGAELRLASLQTGNTYVDTVKVEALTARAAAAARQQDWAGARTNMAEAISLQPENLNLQLSLARILASSDQSDDARALLDDLESEQGRDARITLTRAQVIRISEGLEPSYQYLRAEWEQAGESALMPALLQLAQQAEPEASVALATSWTVQHPENPTAWIALGDRNLQQDQELDAASNYREALRLQPGNIAAMNNLAWLLQDSDPIEAVMLARQAAERAPQNAAILDTYGRVLYKAGNISEALTTLERALELDPENAEIQQHLNEAKAQQ